MAPFKPYPCTAKIALQLPLLDNIWKKLDGKYLSLPDNTSEKLKSGGIMKT